jgi:hypothetical protein
MRMLITVCSCVQCCVRAYRLVASLKPAEAKARDLWKEACLSICSRINGYAALPLKSSEAESIYIQASACKKNTSIHNHFIESDRSCRTLTRADTCMHAS